MFAVDGSSQVEENTFKKAVRFISGISEILDITSTLIHVGFIQYSDFLNTRIEFGLNQYTDSLKVNDSLNNILYSKGKEADLVNALRIVDKEVSNKYVVHHCLGISNHKVIHPMNAHQRPCKLVKEDYED